MHLVFLAIDMQIYNTTIQFFMNKLHENKAVYNVMLGSYHQWTNRGVEYMLTCATNCLRISIIIPQQK